MAKLITVGKFWGVLVFFVLSASLAKSQGNLPPVIQIKADTGLYQNIDDKYWQLLEDPSGKLTIDQVSSGPYASKFHINTTRTKGYNYSVDTYWLRYNFKNELLHPVKLTIPEHVAYAWLYIPAPNNKWKVQTNGEMLPWSKRDGLKRINQFVISLDPGQEIMFYEKDVFDFSTYKPQILQFSIGFAEQVINDSYVNNDGYYFGTILNSLLLGILMMAAFINLLFYRIVREKIYLYFSVFVLCTGLNDFINTTSTAVFREHRHFERIANVFCVILLFFAIMHVIRHFLFTKIHTPKWDKFLVALSYIIVIVWIVQFLLPPALPYRTYLTIYLTCSLFIYTYFPIILATLLFYIRKNKGISRVAIIASLPGFAWWSFGYAYLFIADELNILYKTPYSNFFSWLSGWNNEIQLLCFIWMVILFSWILFRRFQDMQQMLIQSQLDKERLAKEKEIERSQLVEKQNEVLEQQVDERTTELKRSIEELKSAQTQLIQSEKMASLGELTAGIAHEIQNPLNFVNNFSEVNAELIDELEQEISKGDLVEIKAIALDIRENEKKINLHGKRADFIVKGMLQHSRTNTGEKQPTNINVLADEFFKLAYHGLRAKDKSFNAEMVTHFDPDLPQISVTQQDIGRVMLNLFNNAFYAVNHKAKTAGNGYKPTVELATFAPPSGGWGISVKDNGNGIPDAIKDKIMQPFFTTKPTGEGTGLGLSLTYDMVVKGHGGSIQVTSTEGEGSEFTVKLPLN